MGMYDHIYFVGASAARVCCAAGHTQTGALQTKDFDCELADYYVARDNGPHAPVGDRLFVGEVAATDPVVSIVRGQLVMVRTTRYDPSPMSAEVEAYTDCRVCDPVCYEQETGWSVDRLGHRYPSCSWTLTFLDGVLTHAYAAPGKLETRDDVRKQLGAMGLVIVPDDDRVAARHIALLRAGRGR